MGRREVRRKQLLDDRKEERGLEIERGSTRSYYVENRFGQGCEPVVSRLQEEGETASCNKIPSDYFEM